MFSPQAIGVEYSSGTVIVLTREARKARNHAERGNGSARSRSAHSALDDWPRLTSDV